VGELFLPATAVPWGKALVGIGVIAITWANICSVTRIPTITAPTLPMASTVSPPTSITTPTVAFPAVAATITMPIVAMAEMLGLELPLRLPEGKDNPRHRILEDGLPYNTSVWNYVRDMVPLNNLHRDHVAVLLGP
jgi:hypothetical protein